MKKSEVKKGDWLQAKVKIDREHQFNRKCFYQVREDEGELWVYDENMSLVPLAHLPSLCFDHISKPECTLIHGSVTIETSYSDRVEMDFSSLEERIKQESRKGVAVVGVRADYCDVGCSKTTISLITQKLV